MNSHTQAEFSVITRRIYYHDTDCGGVVYYANYLKHLEEGRTELFRERGIDFRDMAGKGAGFVVARVEIDYRAPAHYMDTITILTKVDRIRSSVVRFTQKIMRDDVTVIEARIVLVCIGSDFRPRNVPDEIISSLAS